MNDWMQYGAKVLASALIVVAVSEIAKRNTLIAAIVASIPLTSVLALVWLHAETGDTGRIAALSGEIFWLVLPSLVLFVVLPLLLRRGWDFWAALGAGLAATVAAYAVMLALLARFPGR